MFISTPIQDIDHWIYKQFVWTKNPPSHVKDSKKEKYMDSHARLIVAVQPPWILGNADLYLFAKCKTVSTSVISSIYFSLEPVFPT